MQTLKIDVKFASLTAAAEKISANLKVTARQMWDGYIHPKDKPKVAAKVDYFNINPSVATRELCDICPAIADYRSALGHAFTESQWNLIFRNATANEIALEYYKKGDVILDSAGQPLIDEEGNQSVRQDDGLIVHFAKFELKDSFIKKIEDLADAKFAE